MRVHYEQIMIESFFSVGVKEREREREKHTWGRLISAFVSR